MHPLALLFTLASFTSAFLLFSIQPMFAKLILPRLGGAPAVWNTCLVFFQAALLAGYGLAHLTIQRLGVRRQAWLQIGMLLLPLLVLPIRIPAGWMPPQHSNPIPWLLTLMLGTVGLPFLVVSMSAPLLQRWFAATDHPSSQDPYFLYAASNVGSLGALLSYPMLIEPSLRLTTQRQLWTVGYGVFALLMILCAWFARHTTMPVPQVTVTSGTGMTMQRRWRWVALAFIPSSLMMGVTTYLSTDIAAIPLLWVVPLSVYLLTFVLVFAKRPPIPHAAMVWLLPFIVLPLTIVIGQAQPAWLFIPIHLLLLFTASMICHRALADDRPAPSELTAFYLWLSFGGVLGGIFNALLAPSLFSLPFEYPMAIMLACLMRPGHLDHMHRPNERRLDYLLPMLVAVLTWVVLTWTPLWARVPQKFLLLSASVPAGLMCYAFRDRPIRFGLGVAVLMGVGFWNTLGSGEMLATRRSFFGVYRVTRDRQNWYHTLSHGTTVHGTQSLDPHRQREPLTYYHPTGPLGQVFDSFADGSRRLDRVAVIGLGTGSTGCYATPAQHWTFYEIDPLVVRIATNPNFFTFTRACQERLDVVLGDARLSLARAPDYAYRLMILDAFSSDAIPLHLLTQEAIQLYLSKLADDGIITLHISNRYLKLEPILGAAARAEHLVCISRYDGPISPLAALAGKTPSHWVVLARQRSDLGSLATNPQWNAVRSPETMRVWTDDFSNIVEVLNWKASGR